MKNNRKFSSLICCLVMLFLMKVPAATCFGDIPPNWPIDKVADRYPMSHFFTNGVPIGPLGLKLNAPTPSWQTFVMPGVYAPGDVVLVQMTWGRTAPDPVTGLYSRDSVNFKSTGGKLTMNQLIETEDGSIVKKTLSCGRVGPGWVPCNGFLNLPYPVDTLSKSGYQVLEVIYDYNNDGIVFKDTCKVYIQVQNPNSNPQYWMADRMAPSLAQYPVVCTLRNGAPVPSLGIPSWNGNQESFASAASTSSVYGRNSAVLLGYYTRFYNPAIKTDLRGIPTTSVLAKAYYSFFARETKNTSLINITGYELLKDWTDGGSRLPSCSGVPVPAVFGGGLSYNHSSYPSLWNTPGGFMIGVDRSVVPLSQTSMNAAKGWVTIELDPTVVQRWIQDPSSNRGFGLYAENTVSQLLNFGSSEEPDLALRPYFTLAFDSMESTGPVALPQVPSISVARSTTVSKGIQINWSSGNDDVTVERMIASFGVWDEIASFSANSGVTTYTDVGLSSSHKYFYRVVARNSAGKSVSSEPWMYLLIPEIPKYLTVASSTSSAVNLTWVNSTRGNVEKLVISRKLYGSTISTDIATLDFPAATYTDATVTPGTKYYYQIRAVSVAGSSNLSAAVLATVP